MSSTPVEVTFCSRCQKPTFKPRVDLDYSEINTKTPSLSESAFALDHQKVDEMIFLCDRDLEDYEENLMWLRSQILFIEEQQTRLKAHKTRLRSLSHIRKLPTEILASIFGYTCEWNVLQEYPWRTDEEDRPTKLTSPIISYLPALSLSATCIQWRSVAGGHLGRGSYRSWDDFLHLYDKTLS